MPATSAAAAAVVSAAARSRCCNNSHLGLALKFSNALSISSPLASSSSATTTAVARRAFSNAAYNKSAKGRFVRPPFATNNSVTKTITITTTTTTTTTIPSISATPSTLLHSNNLINANDGNSIVRRSMGTSNRKVIDAKNARRLKIQQKKKKNTNVTSKASDASDGTESAAENDKNNPFLQHQEWVKFQQSITVDGFQTGQTTTATVLKKSRGGKQARRKREKELARLGAFQESSEKTSAVAQKFPPIRYTPEETEALLKEAYETLPKRDGKRGTRNLQRQENRWKKVRKIRSDYKAHLVNAHFRRMDARKYKRDRTKDALESASLQREKDLNYQGMVLKRWTETMNAAASEASDERA